MPDGKDTPQAFDPNAVKLIDYDIADAGHVKKDLVKKFETSIASAPEK